MPGTDLFSSMFALLHVPALLDFGAEDARVAFIEKVDCLAALDLEQKVPRVVHVVGRDLVRRT